MGLTPPPFPAHRVRSAGAARRLRVRGSRVELRRLQRLLELREPGGQIIEQLLRHPATREQFLLLGRLLSKERAPACHPERSARNARVAKDLLLCIEQQILRACGAQDDRLARSLEGRGEKGRIPLISPADMCSNARCRRIERVAASTSASAAPARRRRTPVCRAARSRAAPDTSR